MKGSMAMYAVVCVALVSSLASGLTPLPSHAPTYIATHAPTHPTLAPSAFPTNPSAKPTAVPTQPTPKPTSLGSSPSLAVPTTPAPTTPAPTRTHFPTPTPKPVATGKSAAPSAPTPKPTPTALFQQSVGPYKVAYKVSQRFAASNFGQYQQLVEAASAADNKGWPYFKHWLRNAVLEALPKIGQVQLPNGDWDDKGRYLIDLTASYFPGPTLPLTVVTALGTGVQYLPTIALNYTVEFNGLYMSTIEYDGGQTLVSSGKDFDTKDAYTLSIEIFLANINPAAGGSISEFQNAMNNVYGPAAQILGTAATDVAGKRQLSTANLLTHLVIGDGMAWVGPSKYGFPTMSPTAVPTEPPTEMPTEAPTFPLQDVGFQLAGGFAFLMSFSLFVFCYLQYCPGWIPYYDQIMKKEEAKKIDKSEHTGLLKQVELGRPVDFSDLSEPDIRFGKGHAVKRASMLIDPSSGGVLYSGDEGGSTFGGGKQGAAIMNMAQAMENGGSPRRLSAAPRRGSSSFGAPPPPSAAADEEQGYSGSQPFSSSSVSDDVENPMQSGATAESQSSEADEVASSAPRRSSATAPRLSVMSKLAAAKGRKSVAPPPPAAPDAQSDL